jgi:hypothetical protein
MLPRRPISRVRPTVLEFRKADSVVTGKLGFVDGRQSFGQEITIERRTRK